MPPAHHPLPAAATFPSTNSTKPFWRTHLHPLDSHRTTADLPVATDVAIIGAGLSGILTAYHILKPHNRSVQSSSSITILEARSLCSGATGRNGGHTRLPVLPLATMLDKYGVATATEMADFFSGQIYALKDLVEREELDCDFLVTRNYHVWMDEQGAKDALLAVEKIVEAGISSVRKEVQILKDAKVIEAVTGVQNASAALSVPAAQLWPYKLVTQLAAKIIDRINLQTQTVVQKVSETQDEHGYYHLSTPRGTIKARKVIFATNAYTAGVIPPLEGVITPYRGINSRMVRKAGFEVERYRQARTCTYNVWTDTDVNHVEYIIHRPDGSVILGGAKQVFEEDVQSYIATVDDAVMMQEAGVRAFFRDRMETYWRDWRDDGAEVDMLWSGIMASTPDSLPFVGAMPGAGDQYILAGYNGGGMVYIWLLAQGLARMVAEDVDYQTTGLPDILRITESRLRHRVKEQ